MIDIKKKYKTRNGHEVTLVTTEGRGPYPVIGYIGMGVLSTCWNKAGKAPWSSDLDLVEVKEVKTATGWVNVYSDGRHAAHPTKEEADDYAEEHRLACKEVTFEYTEGEGL